MIWVRCGAIAMFLAIALGSFGAHAWKSRMDAYQLDVFRTATLYHALHALALLGLGWLSAYTMDPKARVAGGFFIAGIVLFSGSLYLLALTGQRWLGAIAPLGGLAFLLGWLCVAMSRKGGV